MMSKNCIICSIIAGNIPSKKVYEDDLVLGVLDVNGANPGHCFVMPKNHYAILEQVPDNEVAKLFQASNKISRAIFESLGSQGTNIFLANGIPAGQTVAHVTVNVIPRKENDGVNLQWAPKQLSEEEISTVELKLKEQAKNVAIEKPREKLELKKEKPIELSQEEEDIYSRQLRRLP